MTNPGKAVSRAAEIATIERIAKIALVALFKVSRNLEANGLDYGYVQSAYDQIQSILKDATDAQP